MGGITSGIGIFSGINSAQLIEQLLAVDARPKALVQNRIVQLKRQQAAYLDVNSSLLKLKTSSSSFDANKIFRSALAKSSDSEVLTATAGTSASPGSYSFLVNRLVTTQQSLSRGFTDRDISAVGASSFTFEVGGGALETDTRLAELNGGNGVTRGKIQVTDSSGASATIDLSTAVTIGDVLRAINSNSAVDVTASVDGDRLVVQDGAGAGGSLVIGNAFGSTTASSLGIAGSAAGGVITGSNIRTLSESTALARLNDGNGVQVRDGSADLRITARDGTILNIDFGTITQTTTDPDTGENVTTTVQTRATTLGDAVNIINSAAAAANGGAGVAISASISGDGTGIVLQDGTGGGGNLIVRGIDNRTTARDLGIQTDVAGVASDSIVGSRLISGLNSVLVSRMNGGAGITLDDLAVTDRAGNSAAITIGAAALSGSVTNLIKDINAQLAGQGVLAKVELNRSGNGFSVTDSSGGNGALVIGGGAAGQLGIETDGATGNRFEGTSAQLQWLSRATRLSSLNGGKGIGTGTFRITDASGATSSVEVGESIRTMDDLIQLINSRPVGVTASINAQGDGLLLTDTSGGTGALRVEDATGTVARSLNIAGEDSDGDGGYTINGSFERRVEFAATDTLQQVVDKINAAGVGVIASIINDGSGSSPFRISFTARGSGTVGRTIIDTGGFDLGLSRLTRGDDAVVFFGASDPAEAVLLTSSTNTLDNVVQGVTIDLAGTSTSPVELVVTRDSAAIEKAISDFVEAYNGVLDTIRKYDVFDSETETRGVLLGDTAVGAVRNTLLRTIQGTALGVEGPYQRLFQVGVRIGSGAKLEFDRERFRGAFESDPANVEALFAANRLAPREPVEVAPGVTVANTSETFSQLGVAEQIEQLVNSLTNSVDGALTNRGRTLDTQVRLQERRITAMDAQLANKRTKLSRQFLAMEQTIAQLQSQSSALQGIQFLG